MTELGILRVGHVEVVIGDELVEDVLCHLAMDRQIVLAAGELGDRAIARHDCERWHAAHGEGLHVIGAEEEDRVRLGLVENFAELLHRRAGLLELIRILIRWPCEHVRGVARADCCNDLAHL